VLRILLIVGAVVLAIAGGAAAFLLLGGGDGVGAYKQAAKERWAGSRASEAPATAFRATVCAVGPCVLVEVAGLNFLIGASEDAADGLKRRGLLRRDLDGVLLDELNLQNIEGLPALGEAMVGVGRADPLPVYGPEGVVPLVDGANLMLSGGGDDHLRFAAGDEGADQGASGKVVYDSGVVTVLAFGVRDGAKARVYRIDTPQRSLIYAGCEAGPEDVVAAARGARQAAAVIGASSAPLMEIEREAAKAAGQAVPATPKCMTHEEAVGAIQSARLAAGLILPLAPLEGDSVKAWAASATIPKELTAAVGEPGTVLDLSDEQPAIHKP
jgi:hypothetical protein